MVGDPQRERKKSFLKRSLENASQIQASNFIRKSGFSKEKKSENVDKLSGDQKFYLHPLFRNTKVEKFYSLGEYGEAVRVAFLKINNRVKRITKQSLDGAPLMRKVFSRNSPILDFNNLSNTGEGDEQEGLMHIFEGCMLAYRNPPSHNDELLLKEFEAKPILQIANYLMLKLDRFDK